jgi:hypothetical protein
MPHAKLLDDFSANILVVLLRDLAPAGGANLSLVGLADG